MKLFSLKGKFIKETFSVPKGFTGIVEWDGGDKSWLQNGNWHRLGGPAYTGINLMDRFEFYFIDDKKVTKEQHDLLVDIMKLKELM